MTQEITGPVRDFEAIKKFDGNGMEYWEARELMPLLGYGEKWQNFSYLVERAKKSCESSQQLVTDHFTDVSKMIKLAIGSVRESNRKVKDYKLSRYACYLTAQNGDPRKEAIALAANLFRITQTDDLLQRNLQQGKKLGNLRVEENKNIKL